LHTLVGGEQKNRREKKRRSLKGAKIYLTMSSIVRPRKGGVGLDDLTTVV